jgi:hypothetical protein
MEKELPQNSTAGIKRLKGKGGGRHQLRIMLFVVAKLVMIINE